MSGPDARRQREAALLAVAAVEAAAEAEAAKPKASQAQTLLAAFYDLTGREPPPGVVLPDASAAAPAMERAKRAADARDVAVYGAVYKPPPPPPPARAVYVGRPVCIGPFGGADAREVSPGRTTARPRESSPRVRSSRGRASTSGGWTRWTRRGGRRKRAGRGATGRERGEIE